MTEWTLLVICQAGGIFLLISVMLLVGLRRIYFDAETKQPIEFEIPLLGKIRTQAPAFAIIAVGAGMVALPLSKMHEDLAVLNGEISTGGKSVSVLIVPTPQYQVTTDASGPFTVTVPILPDASYRVKFLVDKQIIDDQPATLEHHRLVLQRKVVWSGPPSAPVIPTKKEIPDEVLKQYNIPH
jgi:hypothetical protein